MTVLASLGMSCQTAHQCARYAETRGGVRFSKGPMDWAMLPATEAARWLERGLDAPERGEVVERDGRAWWTRGGFWFWHGYFSKSEVDGAVVRTLDIEATWERERSKLDHQRETMRTLDARDTLFVWSNVQNNLAKRDRVAEGDGVFGNDAQSAFTLREAEWRRLGVALDAFMGAPCRTVAFSVPGRDPHAVGERIEPGASQWKGEGDAWDTALDRNVAHGAEV